MLQRKIPTWAAAAALLLLTVFVAGFFHESAGRRSASPAPCAPAPAGRQAVLREVELAHAARVPAVHVPDNLYRRAGDFSSKVESVIKAYAELDKKIAAFGGEITEMEITGNDDGRQGRISCTVASDKFNPFIDYVRTLGKVMAERITATARPRAQGGRAIPGDDEIDQRELSLVTLALMDEKVAKDIQESRGMLAGSFMKSASHFMAGVAVLVEIFGWIAPYLLILALAFVPAVAVRHFRRRTNPDPLGAAQVR